MSLGRIYMTMCYSPMAGLDSIHRSCRAAVPVESFTGTKLRATWAAGFDSLSKNQVREIRPTNHMMKGSLVPGLQRIPLLSSKGRLTPHSRAAGSLSKA